MDGKTPNETAQAELRLAPSHRAPELAGVHSWLDALGKIGAGEGARTLDPDLGKVVLYH